MCIKGVYTIGIYVNVHAYGANGYCYEHIVVYIPTSSPLYKRHGLEFYAGTLWKDAYVDSCYFQLVTKKLKLSNHKNQ